MTILQQSPFLREQRQFPSFDVGRLANQMDHAYIDIASKMNYRTVGLFATDFQIVNGESWFLHGQPNRQQGLRQVYPFSDSSLTIAHGINFTTLTNFTRIYGTFFDGTQWQTLPYVDVVAANNQIKVDVNATNIVVTKGAGAPPTIANGLIILEWISQV